MKTILKKTTIASLALVTGFSLASCSKDEKMISNPNVETGFEYEIYPKVQNIEYLDKGFEIGNSANLVIESGVSQVTIDRLLSNLKKTTIQNITISDKVQEGVTNILVGIEGSNGYVDNYSNKYEAAEDGLYTKLDAYHLYLNNGLISIVGLNDDACFYAVETLNMILSQADKNNKNIVRNAVINDYSFTEYRGIIEGFYGVPWTTSERISLIEFGSKFKMNQFIFAPKDDKYHSSKWRELYPAKELNEMKKLVASSIENNVDFTWAIHPFMHDAVDFGSNYSKDLEAVKTKLMQLYEIGVRHFALSADDIAELSQASDYVTLATNHAKIANDLVEWGKTLPEAVTWQIVPTKYFKNSKYSTEYISTLGEKLSTEVEIYWTGDEIMGQVNKSTTEHFKKTAGRSPLFWLNWPVSDYLDTNIFMAEATCLLNETDSIKGMITNPMSQAEASKIGIFQVLDYGWNVKGFDSSKSYRASFDYVDETHGEELYTFAQNLATYEPGSFWVAPITNKESHDFLPLIDPVLEMSSDPDKFLSLNKSQVREVIDPMYLQLNKVIRAIDVYKECASNKKLVAEITPWMNSLRDLMIAGIRYMDIFNRFVRGEGEESLTEESILSSLDKAKTAVTDSQSKYMVNVVDAWGSLYYASSGDLVLQPFFRKLNDNITNIANKMAK